MPIETKKHDSLVYRVYDYLRDNHVGQANAIKGADLAARFGTDRRSLRNIIREIRNSDTLEKLVAGDESGYYVCANAEEYEKANNRLYSAAFSLLRTARANEKKAGMDGQFKIRLGKYFSETFNAYGD